MHKINKQNLERDEKKLYVKLLLKKSHLTYSLKQMLTYQIMKFIDYSKF